MIKSIQELFSTKVHINGVQPSEEELTLAAATLMFEMAKADGKVDDVELSAMAKSLQKQFDLDSDNFEALLDSAKLASENAISLQKFTRQLCENWDNEQRVILLEHLWTIAFADQTIDAHERHLVRKIAGLLYLTDSQINLAKEKAKHRQASL